MPKFAAQGAVLSLPRYGARLSTLARHQSVQLPLITVLCTFSPPPCTATVIKRSTLAGFCDSSEASLPLAL